MPRRLAEADSAWWRALTIVVCSSPVPSNPDTSTLRAVMASLALVPNLPHCAKVIQFDGPQPALPDRRVRQYIEFKKRVRGLVATDRMFVSTEVHESDRFLFAAHNLAAAVTRVNTSLFLNLQHDYQLARAFDARGLVRTMLAVRVVHHVRLNMRANAPSRGFDGVIENASLPGQLVPLTKTCGWSDAPHVARTSYYRDFVIPMNLADHNNGRRKFMEESLHYRMQQNFKPGGCWELKQRMAKGERPLVWPANFDRYGTYLYGYASPTDGSYTIHRSLRGNVPQWGFNHNPRHVDKPHMRRGRTTAAAGTDDAMDAAAAHSQRRKPISATSKGTRGRGHSPGGRRRSRGQSTGGKRR